MVYIYKIINDYSLKGILNRIKFLLKGRVVRLKTKNNHSGNALLSYTTLPFTLLDEKKIGGHSQYWEAKEMANIMLDKGYNVDVIDSNNKKFSPKKSYNLYIDIGSNIDRIYPLLPRTCTKNFHATGAHWLFQNTAEYNRLLGLQSRKNKTLIPQRNVEPILSIDKSDLITVLGNDFTVDTYKHTNVRVVRTPISTTHTFPFNKDKDYEKVRKNYIWFGGAGAVHKGLDLVLEVFKELPDYNLNVCGKPTSEVGFSDVYKEELSNYSNIKVVGYIDPSSDEFSKICRQSIGIIFPSCSEGGGGSVIVAMHAGLIPVVSYEASVDVGDFGIQLDKTNINSIKEAVTKLSSENSDQLHDRSKKTWNYVRENHTREKFSHEYKKIIDDIKKHNL